MFFFAGVATALIHFSKEIQQCIHHVGSCSSIFPMVGIHDQFIQVTHKWMLTIKQLCCPWFCIIKTHRHRHAETTRCRDAETCRHKFRNEGTHNGGINKKIDFGSVLLWHITNMQKIVEGSQFINVTELVKTACSWLTRLQRLQIWLLSWQTSLCLDTNQNLTFTQCFDCLLVL